MATLLLLLLASNPSPPYVRGRNGVPTLPAIKDVDTAVENRQPILLTSSPWPASKDLAAWTPASITKLVPELGPVRIGTDASAGAHEFWNVNFGVARDDEASPNGFRPARLSNELVNATMPTERFWAPRSAESDAVHYYSGSLLEDDGRASVPDLQRGLDELVAILGRDPEGFLAAHSRRATFSRFGSAPRGPRRRCTTTRSTTSMRSCPAPRSFGCCRHTQPGTTCLSIRASILSPTSCATVGLAALTGWPRRRA